MTTKLFKVNWSPSAYADLQNIYYYIKKFFKEPEIANNLSKKILKSISDLSYFPEKYPKIKYKSKNIRKMLVNNYVIIYEINNNTNIVSVLHIFNNRQNYFYYL